MARNEQLIRQHRILQILERYRFGVPLDELRDMIVEELGLTSLHTRSIRRDLAALQAAGIDVDSEETERGRVWKLGARFRGTHTITASASEMMALSLGRDLMLPLVGTPFWIGIESFWSKIQESLPGAVWDHYQRYRKALHVVGVPVKSYAPQQGIIKTIHRGIVEHRLLEIEYQSLHEKTPQIRQIAAYGIVLYHGSLYALAEPTDSEDGALKHYKIDRFERATALDRWFEPRPGFSLEEYLEGSIGVFGGSDSHPQTFRLRIAEFAVPWIVEDPWHPDQQVARQEDGSAILTLTAAHELEILPRILALGNQVEVLEPSSTRDRLRRIAREMLDLYDQ